MGNILLEIDPEPIFKLALHYLINHENIILGVDSSNEARVYYVITKRRNDFSYMTLI